MMVTGLLAMIGDVAARKSLKSNKSIFILGQVMILTGIWVLTETNIRQLIFNFPSISFMLPYIALEFLLIFALKFFDEVQNKYYHKSYVILMCCMAVQIFINIVLSVSQLYSMHDTLPLAHFWIIFSILYGLINIIRDIVTKRINSYRITAIGMLFFLVLTATECIAFYAAFFRRIGVAMCLGLMALLIATVVQAIYNAIKHEKEYRARTVRDAITTIETIAGSIDAKDEYTGGHSERVAYYANILARAAAKEYNLKEEDIVQINYTALLHDIGKIGIPDAILNKPGKLTDDEYHLMKRHTIIGDALIHGASDLEYLSDGIRYHHERYDGNGYPDKLKGEEIPFVGRILCLADAYDAMTSNRVYRSHLTNEWVREEIERCAGKQFDPRLAEIFCELLDNGEITPQTEQGLDVMENGEVRKSALLRHLLTKNLFEGRRNIKNPSYVTMVSYVAKIKENQGKNVNIFLIGVRGINGEELSPEQIEEAKENIKKAVDIITEKEDITIDYSTLKRLVVWVNVDENEIDKRIQIIKSMQKDWYDVEVKEIK